MPKKVLIADCSVIIGFNIKPLKVPTEGKSKETLMVIDIV